MGAELLLPPMKGEWIEPDSDDVPLQAETKVILYFHGGGYFFFSPQSHRPITFALAAGTNTRVFSLDYRRAPEHRFPAAVEDAVAAYRRLMMDGDTWRRTCDSWPAIPRAAAGWRSRP